MTATQKLIEQLLAERVRQDEKWGVQNHPFTYPGSQRDPGEYRKQAEFWKSLNDHRVRKQTDRGIPADRNCAWDGIILEEINEALAEERPGLQYAETLQATAVLFAMMDKLDRDSRENSGHAIWCPALDVDGVLTAPECCDCATKSSDRYEARCWDNTAPGEPTYRVWDTWGESWVTRFPTTNKAAAEHRAEEMNEVDV